MTATASIIVKYEVSCQYCGQDNGGMWFLNEEEAKDWVAEHNQHCELIQARSQLEDVATKLIDIEDVRGVTYSYGERPNTDTDVWRVFRSGRSDTLYTWDILDGIIIKEDEECTNSQ